MVFDLIVWLKNARKIYPHSRFRTIGEYLGPGETAVEVVGAEIIPIDKDEKGGERFHTLFAVPDEDVRWLQRRRKAEWHINQIAEAQRRKEKEEDEGYLLEL